jgi:hypothetical protein
MFASVMRWSIEFSDAESTGMLDADSGATANLPGADAARPADVDAQAATPTRADTTTRARQACERDIA